MSVPVTVMLMILNVANVFLHSIGIYLLFCLHKQGKSNTQNIYIGNLSISELLMNFLEMLRHPFVLCLKYGTYKPTHFMRSIVTYISIIMFMGISFVFYMDMIYITLDRLLNILLNLRYRLYWGNRRAKLLLQGTWLVGCLLTIVVVVAHQFGKFTHWEVMLYKYVYPTLEFAFVILAFTTYIFIFKKYKSSQTVITKRKMSVQQNKKPDSAYDIFRKSRFFVPVLLILTFILFIVIPDLVIMVVSMVQEEVPPELLASCWISYALSNIVDGYIYIFMQNSVRKLFYKNWKRLCCVKSKMQQKECPNIQSKTQNVSEELLGRKLSKIISPRLTYSARTPSSQSTFLSCNSPPVSPTMSSLGCSTSSYSRRLLSSSDTPTNWRRQVNFSIPCDDKRLLSDGFVVNGDDDVFREPCVSDKVFVS